MSQGICRDASGLYMCETRTYVSTTDHGSASLIVPKKLTADDLEDLAAWVSIIMRMLHRQVALESAALAADQPATEQE